MLHDLGVGARFLRDLPRSLKNSFGLAEARSVLRERLEQREARFLSLVRRSVYGNERSPYQGLLQLVGCEYGDLERLVAQEGVEGALHVLYRKGVFLTVDEFKGRRPIARGSGRVVMEPADLRNPGLAGHIPVDTGGSRGRRTSIMLSLDFVRDHAINTFLTLDAHGGSSWRHAHWGVPGGAAIVNLIEFCFGGAPPSRWFSQIDLATQGLHRRYRWSAHALRLGGALAGVRLPAPLYVPLHDPLPIAQWMKRVLRDGYTPHLWTYASGAVRVCRAAYEAGIDLRGARFTAGGEPMTAARLASISRAGAEALPRYGTTETDIIGYACQRPDAPDDLHLLHDRHAFVQPGFDGAIHGVLPLALLVTSLLASSPVILLNVSLGDQAVMIKRACGCPLERLGWATHLQAVRSFEKLTAGGMTFLDTDVIRVLEEVLPARFGGAPTDYQLVEQDIEGEPRLSLLIDPGVGEVDVDLVAELFLRAIGGGSGLERVMELQWRDGRFLRVERRSPLTTASGKIQHLHTTASVTASPLPVTD